MDADLTCPACFTIESGGRMARCSYCGARGRRLPTLAEWDALRAERDRLMDALGQAVTAVLNLTAERDRLQPDVPVGTVEEPVGRPDRSGRAPGTGREGRSPNEPTAVPTGAPWPPPEVLAAILDQRARGWPDSHPEDYCHHCGRRNPLWFSPEWPELIGGHGGILCPLCFTEYDPAALWLVTRHHPPEADAVALLAALLQSVSDLGEDSTRVARCLIDAGWTSHKLEGGA